MPEIREQPAADDTGFFTSDCDVVEIREEDTKPGKVSDRYRRMLEEKYGRKEPPRNGSGQE